MGHSLANEIETFQKSIHRYLSRVKRSKIFFHNAKKISFSEIIASTESILRSPHPFRLADFAKTLTTSGIWVSHSFLRHLYTLIDFEKERYARLNSPEIQNILKRVKAGEPISSEEASQRDIFQAIYMERDFIQHHPHDSSLLTIPKIKTTLVLVDGVLNEIFSTTMFERSLKNLSRLYDLKYFIPDIHGVKGTKINANALRKQIEGYISNHKDEKLWIVGYSKGGIDSLHYLWENSEFAKKYILGISTIASPILGSYKFENRLLKVINSIHGFSDTKLYKKIGRKRDIFFKDVMEYLNQENQRPWFRRNYKELPSQLFYTAVALESEWYESHFWMVLTKIIFQSKEKNDGIVECKMAQFPQYFKGINLGNVKGHHLIGTRSSYHSQEALIEAHIIYLNYLNFID